MYGTLLHCRYCPAVQVYSLGVFGGNAGITNQGLNTRLTMEYGTTAASSLVTGFTMFQIIYTITPLTMKGLLNYSWYSCKALIIKQQNF
jgi:hypothetical protein